MSARDRWLAAARDIVDRVRGLLAPYGLIVDPSLTVGVDSHPCPGYRHATTEILFCPPVVENGVDRLRWLFFCKVMGVQNIQEAEAFYDIALPLVIAHELAHHLRFKRNLASDSPFVEEQVCDRLGVAFLDGLGGFDHDLERTRIACALMRDRLGQQYGQKATRDFVPDIGDVLLAQGDLSPESLSRIEHAAATTGTTVEELLRLSAGREAVDWAATQRRHAGDRVDSRYTEDPAEYWYLGCNWLAGYLARQHRPGLDEILRQHLLDRDKPDDDLEIALKMMLEDGTSPVGGAEGLLELRGADAVPMVVEALQTSRSQEQQRGLMQALAFAWPTDRSWPTDAIAALLTRTQLPLQPLLRLCGVVGLAAPEWLIQQARASNDDSAVLESLAASPGDSTQLIIHALSAPDRAVRLLEAWCAWQRGRGELPEEAMIRTMRRPSARLSSVLAHLGTPAERVAALPPRGSDAWSAAVTSLASCASEAQELAAREDAPMRARLRAAALVVELGGACPELEPIVKALERSARGMVMVENQLAKTGTALGRLAAEQLRLNARRAALEIMRATSPRETAPTLHRVAMHATAAVAMDPALLKVLFPHLPPRLRFLFETTTPPSELEPVLEQDLIVTDSDSSLIATAKHMLGQASPASRETMASNIERAINLRSVPLFARLEPARLWQLAEVAVEMTFEAGVDIFQQGEVGDRLFLVVSGRVEIEKDTGDGTPLRLAELDAGSAFGEMALFDGSPRSATVRAVSRCRLLTLSTESLRRLGRDNPQIYESLLAALSDRLRATSTLAANME